MVAGFPAPEAYFGFESRLRWPRQGPQRRNNAYDTRRGSPATELDCYVPGKDVVVPVDAIVGQTEVAKLLIRVNPNPNPNPSPNPNPNPHPNQVAKLPRPGETFACRPPRKAKVLLLHP